LSDEEADEEYIELVA
jgi:hypothetical protein